MFAGSAEAQVSNLNTDFSTTNGNPNGAWTYGQFDPGLTTFTPYGLADNDTTPEWRPNSSPLPNIWKNMSTNVMFQVLPGQVSLHPGSMNEPSAARFTAPFAGTYDATWTFHPGDSGLMPVSVRVNDVTLWSASDSGSSLASIPLTAGGTIDFVVASPGSYLFGNTPLDAVIVAIPEPVAATMLGISALALLRARRR